MHRPILKSTKYLIHGWKPASTRHGHRHRHVTPELSQENRRILRSRGIPLGQWLLLWVVPMLMPGRSDQHHAVICEPTSLVIIQESGLPSKFYQAIENSVEPGIGVYKIPLRGSSVYFLHRLFKQFLMQLVHFAPVRETGSQTLVSLILHMPRRCLLHVHLLFALYTHAREIYLCKLRTSHPG